jgi:hypothetical protein
VGGGCGGAQVVYSTDLVDDLSLLMDDMGRSPDHAFNEEILTKEEARRKNASSFNMQASASAPLELAPSGAPEIHFQLRAALMAARRQPLKGSTRTSRLALPSRVFWLLVGVSTKHILRGAGVGPGA